MNLWTDLKTSWDNYSEDIRQARYRKGKAERLITLSAVAGALYLLLTGSILRQYYDNMICVLFILVAYFCMPHRRKTIRSSQIACIGLIVWAITLALFTEAHPWQIIYAIALVIIPAVLSMIIRHRNSATENSMIGHSQESEN